MTKQPNNPAFKPALSLWFKYYKDRTGENYVMDAKSGNHLKQLLKKIESKMREKGLEPTSDQVVNSLAVLLVSIKDKWILDNLEIAIVNGKFNAIIAQAKRNSPVMSASRIDDIVAERGYNQRTG